MLHSTTAEPARCGWCRAVLPNHAPGCMENRLDREVSTAPATAPEAFDREQLEQQLGDRQARDVALRVQLAAIVNLASGALSAADATPATRTTALEKCLERAQQALKILGGDAPPAA